MYKAVIFDVGGVLHQNNKAVSADLREELGLTEDQLNKIWSHLIPQLGSGKIAEEEFWAEISQEYGIRIVTTQENLLGRAFDQAFRAHDSVLTFIDKLKTHGIILAALSDTIEPHAQALRAHGLFGSFTATFLSHETGLRKPDPAAYQHVLNQLGLKPDETIFVDDKEENITAANTIGIRGIPFTTPERMIIELSALLLPVDQGNADVLLVSKDGSLVLQKRDNKPGISNPGLLTGFGGHIDKGEIPLEALLRELEEETNLKPQPEELKFLNLYHKTKAVHGEDWDVWYFVLKNVDTTTLKTYEGDGFQIVTSHEQAKQLHTSILTQDVLNDYYDQFSK